MWMIYDYFQQNASPHKADALYSIDVDHTDYLTFKIVQMFLIQQINSWISIISCNLLL